MLLNQPLTNNINKIDTINIIKEGFHKNFLLFPRLCEKFSRWLNFIIIFIY